MANNPGARYSFTLRPGLKWHDGAPVKAEDCVASLNRFFVTGSIGKSLANNTASLEVVDDKTFVLKLKQRFGFMLDTLANTEHPPFMYPKRLAEGDPRKRMTEAIGSGPFKFDRASWRLGSEIVFVKNADYVPRTEPQDMMAGGKVARLDRIVWKIIPDNQTAVNAIVAGEVDMMEAPAADSLPILRATKGIVVAPEDPRATTIFIRFNSLTPPFDNVKARKAVSMMVDQEEYLKVAAGPGESKVCKSIYTCNSPYTSTIGTEMIGSKNVEEAKQLLKESGYSGQKVVVLQPTDIADINGFALIAAQEMRSIGINVELAASDWPTLIQRRSKKVPAAEGGWNLFLTTGNGGILESPIVNLASNASCATAWVGWPYDEKIEAIRADFALSDDPAKRKQLADQLQARVLELATWVPGGQYDSFSAWRDVVTNVIRGPATPLYEIGKSAP